MIFTSLIYLYLRVMQKFNIVLKRDVMAVLSKDWTATFNLTGKKKEK